MTPQQFVYWIQGFAELSEQAPSETQWNSIKEHLDLVFKKESRQATKALLEHGRISLLSEPPTSPIC
ncbi:hypothetical protein [Serratia quinivorans]